MNYTCGLRVLLTGVLSLVLSGCTPAVPVGSIGSGGLSGGGGVLSGSASTLLVVPQRSVSNVNDVLTRNDFSAYVHANSAFTKINAAELAIGIIEDPDYPGDVTPVPSNGNYLFRSSGVKGVVVSRGGVSGQSQVQVLDPLGLGGGGGGGTGGGEGPGITITW
jgi:hypothetical protein